MKHSVRSGMWVWLVLVACVVTARAHDLKLSSIKVRLDQSSVKVSVVTHAHSLSKIAARNPADEISQRLQMRLDGKPFRAESAKILRDAKNGIVIWQAEQKGAATSVAVDAPLFPEKIDESTVVTVLKDRQILGEAQINAQQPTAQISSGENSAPHTVSRQFLRTGIEHIFGGLDHVLFLLSLLLLGGTWKQLLKIVTAFTLAHSVTLSLAATGVFVPPARLIEPVIALSIVAVAGLNLRKKEVFPDRVDVRPWLALAFGLIHGFGFASALTETGLAQEALGWALLSFNIGVEIGQAALVVVIAPTLAWLIKSQPRWREPMVFYGSVSVAATGAFWFAERIFSV